ncbi:AMP-binding enzyme [Arthrobacter rhombi]|uniref:AMP-binding enzyme n=1 Tax=Arthrobacter rhombi TaxID=71253 RepID=UPI003D161AB6
MKEIITSGGENASSIAGELEERVVSHATQHLARFQVPKMVRVFAELPKTVTGKIRKNEVRAQLE